MENKVNEFVERAVLKPEISFIEAISLDRILKADDRNFMPISFSKNGIAPKSNKKDMDNFLNTSFRKKKNSLAKWSKNFNPKENMINGFEELENYEINTINILYANYLLSNNDFHAWKYFFNKYLSIYNGWKIDLEFFKFSNIFDVIKGSTSSKDMYYSDTLVSVIMPVFNNENTISYAVNSILNQTHQNIELIIVDDCSTDTTELICKKLIKNDNRIKYLKNQQNSGAYISRNNGLKIANGDYITILDGDDWSFPQRIEYQLNQLKLNFDAKAHLGYYIRIHSNGFIDNFKVCTDWCFDGLLSKCLASMMIEKKFFDEVLGYWDSVRFGADSELYYRILAIDEKLILEDIIPLYLALDRENSLTNSEATKIGGELRSQYAKAFLGFHQNSTLEKLYYTFPQTKRPFVVPNEMELNSTIQIDITQLSVETITDLQQLKKIKSNISRFDFLTEEFKYQCLWQLNKKSKYFFVLFHGANDRSKKHPPYFERWSWQNDFNGSILNISDPTLLLDDKLRLAWYIGNKNEYPVEIIVSIVKELANIHGIESKNIVFYGSSGAGYTSLACSRYIPNSNAVAINAQTNVMNYHQGHVSDMLKACFGSTDHTEIEQKYKERLDMVDYYSNNKYSNNIFFVQNEKDEFHYKNHFLPFIEKTNLSKQKILLYSNESGYGPEPRNMVEEILNKSGIYHNDFLWISMGENCLPDNILQRFNRKTFSTPYSSNRTNIDYVISCENDQYENLLLRENLSYDTAFAQKVIRSTLIHKCDDIFDKHHMKGFEFTHHNVIESEKDRESYKRRIKRLIDSRKKENIVFFYFHRFNSKSNLELLREKVNQLIGFYKGNENSVFIVLFYQQPLYDNSERRIETKIVNENFFEYIYHTEFNWAGNDPKIFWGLNDNDLISKMFEDLDQKISNRISDLGIVENNNVTTDKKILLLGTCRLHRLFMKNDKGKLIDNTDDKIKVVYPKLGFFHTLPEILQVIRWMKKDISISGNVAKYVFRKENPSTTPLNEFDEQLEYSIKNNIAPVPLNVEFETIDWFIFEICSLKSYFHANPNFAGNIPYAQIPKEGIYSDNALNVTGVINKVETEVEIENHFKKLFEYIQPQKTIIMGHLLDPLNPNEIRQQVNNILKNMSDKFHFKYVDTSIFVGEYGFNKADNNIDIHHLSHEGEIELGKYIQSLVLNMKEVK